MVGDCIDTVCNEDCFCWTPEVQCKFSACVSTYQGFDFPNIRWHPCDTYCISGNDNAGYHSVYSCFHANWLGFTFDCSGLEAHSSESWILGFSEDTCTGL
uniref:Uncharacterized protein n=1 Tax=Opuntia streptacantha TaxID=393608 RepID=A0A7C8Z2F3_OPUST